MSSPASQRLLLRFGSFELDPGEGELRKAGITLKMHPQPFQVLLLLTERPGQIVTRDEIQQSLWGGNTFVDFERGINFCISQLRATLADTADSPRYIETVPRRGYRFIAPIDAVPSSAILPLSSPIDIRIAKRSAAFPPNRQTQEMSERRLTARGRNPWRFFAPLVVLGVVAALSIGFSRHKWQSGRSQLQLTEQQLTSNAPEDYVMSSAISPDGKYLAYADQTGFFARSLDSGEIRPAFLPADFPPSQIYSIAWFPDGGKLLLTRWTVEGFSLWVVPVLGQAPPQLFRKNAAEAAISPDGKSIAFWSGALYGPQELWVSGINGETPHEIAVAAPVDPPGSLSWSPDGKWIAYFDWSSSKSEAAGFTIDARPASGGASKLLVSNADLPNPLALDPYGLCWSPDWRLFFEVAKSASSPENRQQSLWQAHVDSDRLRLSQPLQQLTQWTDSRSLNLNASNDGKNLAILESRIHQDVYLAELQVGRLKTPQRFTLDNRDSFPELWARDSQSILYVSNRNGRNELFQQTLKDSVPKKMESSATDDIGYGNALTPDGKWLLFWEIPPQSSGKQHPLPVRLMRQQIGEGAPEQLVEMPYDDGVNANVRCALKTGNRCVMQLLGGKNGGNILFYTVDPIRGKGDLLGSIQIPDLHVVGWSLSPDGSEISVLGHKDRIDILDLSTRAWHTINVQPSWGDFQSVAWDAKGQGFFLTTVLPQSFNLIHVGFNSKVQLLLTNAHRQWFFQPLPSPNGRYLAFQAQTFDSNVWLLQNF